MKVWAVYKKDGKRPVAMFLHPFEADHYVDFAPVEWGCAVKVEDWRRP